LQDKTWQPTVVLRYLIVMPLLPLHVQGGPKTYQYLKV